MTTQHKETTDRKASIAGWGENNHFTDMCCDTEAGSYSRLIDSCITQLKAQGPARTCNESKEEEAEEAEVGAGSTHEACRRASRRRPQVDPRLLATCERNDEVQVQVLLRLSNSRDFRGVDPPAAALSDRCSRHLPASASRCRMPTLKRLICAKEEQGFRDQVMLELQRISQKNRGFPTRFTTHLLWDVTGLSLGV